MSENTHEWTRKIASLAIQGANKYEDLNTKGEETMDEQNGKFFLGDYDLQYSNFMAKTVDAGRLEEKSLLYKTINSLIKKTAFGKELDFALVKNVISREKESLADFTLDALTDSIQALAPAINKWLENGKVDPIAADGLKAVADGIESGDEYLITKVIADSLVAGFTAADVGVLTQRDFIRELITHNIPEVNVESPKNMDSKTVAKLSEYGLLKYIVGNDRSFEGTNSDESRRIRTELVEDSKERLNPENKKRLTSETIKLTADNIDGLIKKFGDKWVKFARENDNIIVFPSDLPSIENPLPYMHVDYAAANEMTCPDDAGFIKIGGNGAVVQVADVSGSLYINPRNNSERSNTVKIIRGKSPTFSSVIETDITNMY